LKVALYARVSTTEQKTDNQMDILRPLAERRGYEVVHEYIDHASGKDANRPNFKLMMEAAARHDFDAIFVLRIDRVMRSLIHLHTILQNLSVYGVRLIFSDMDIDPGTPMGKVIMNFLASIAEWERETISIRTREGLASRKAKGIKLGKARRDDIPILDIAKMRLSGMGWKKIADLLKIPKSTLIDRAAEINIAIEQVKVSDNVPIQKEGSVMEGTL